MEYAIELLQEQKHLLIDEIESLVLVDNDLQITAKRLYDVDKALNKLIAKPTKPISELTKEDAIEIAKACVSDSIVKDWDVVTDSNKTITLSPKQGNKNILFDVFKPVFSISFFRVHRNHTEMLVYDIAKATDKARELGYDV